MKNMMRFKTVARVSLGLVATVGLMFGSLAPVWGGMAEASVFDIGGQVFLGAEGTDSEIEDQLEDNVYVMGEYVRMQIPLLGDFFSLGNVVEIVDEVEGDVMVGGEMVRVSGDVAGDVRIVGGEVIIDGRVEGDVMVAGGEVIIEQGAVVGGDVFVMADGFINYGEVSGETVARVGEFRLEGAMIEGEIRARKAIFGGESQIGGRVVYEGPMEAEGAPLLAEGSEAELIFIERVFDQPVKERGENRIWMLLTLLTRATRGLTYIVSAVVLFAIARKWLAPYLQVKEGVGGMVTTMLIGLVAWFGAIIGIGALMLTVFGSGVAVGFGALFILWTLVSRWMVAPFIGAWIVKWVKGEKEPQIGWLGTLVGAVIVALSCLWIPTMLVTMIFTVYMGGVILRKTLSI